jgi:hypothetical protein
MTASIEVLLALKLQLIARGKPSLDGELCAKMLPYDP